MLATQDVRVNTNKNVLQAMEVVKVDCTHWCHDYCEYSMF